MDIKQMLLDTTDQQNHARWTGSMYALRDLANHIKNIIESKDYKNPEKFTSGKIAVEITKHIVEEIKRYEELILTTDMGKKMKEIGDKYGT